MHHHLTKKKKCENERKLVAMLLCCQRLPTKRPIEALKATHPIKDLNRVCLGNIVAHLLRKLNRADEIADGDAGGHGR
ncbi:Uncharacterized protein TCM_014516 [Theobroma cacao]|uniref:Uncharacterized protein n=1 Tax=Theobroma cacao TaxID=3641 RepID=A0A061FXP8_THECC|nr:Uncharacterized protein TCM_014516 [Theobroma cacao]